VPSTSSHSKRTVIQSISQGPPQDASHSFDLQDLYETLSKLSLVDFEDEKTELVQQFQEDARLNDDDDDDESITSLVNVLVRLAASDQNHNDQPVAVDAEQEGDEQNEALATQVQQLLALSQQELSVRLTALSQAKSGNKPEQVARLLRSGNPPVQISSEEVIRLGNYSRSIRSVLALRLNNRQHYLTRSNNIA